MSLFIPVASETELIACNKAKVGDLLKALCRINDTWCLAVDKLLITLSDEKYNQCGWNYIVPCNIYTEEQIILYCIRKTLQCDFK